MGCRNDYMNPNDKEIESQRVCQLLKYILEAQDKFVSKEIEAGANSSYGNTPYLDAHTAVLCSECQNLGEKEANKIIYDGRNPNARKLADWWENHQELDKERKQLEKDEKKRERIRKKALSKLTPQEIEALDLE